MIEESGCPSATVDVARSPRTPALSLRSRVAEGRESVGTATAEGRFNDHGTPPGEAFSKKMVTCISRISHACLLECFTDGWRRGRTSEPHPPDAPARDRGTFPALARRGFDIDRAPYQRKPLETRPRRPPGWTQSAPKRHSIRAPVFLICPKSCPNDVDHRAECRKVAPPPRDVRELRFSSEDHPRFLPDPRRSGVSSAADDRRGWTGSTAVGETLSSTSPLRGSVRSRRGRRLSSLREPDKRAVRATRAGPPGILAAVAKGCCEPSPRGLVAKTIYGCPDGE
jgi:hypothetical protein